jgi:hypothetical protein
VSRLRRYVCVTSDPASGISDAGRRVGVRMGSVVGTLLQGWAPDQLGGRHQAMPRRCLISAIPAVSSVIPPGGPITLLHTSEFTGLLVSVKSQPASIPSRHARTLRI